MTAALTPDLLLGYLQQLCPAMEAGVVLDGDGRRLAGPAWVAELVDELAGGTPDAGARLSEEGEVRRPTPRGELFVIRTPGHQLAVVAGAPVLAELLVHDMRRVLADLEDSRR